MGASSVPSASLKATHRIVGTRHGGSVHGIGSLAELFTALAGLELFVATDGIAEVRLRGVLPGQGR